MSAKTGVAPVRATELAVAAKVNDGTMTSSPGPTPARQQTEVQPGRAGVDGDAGASEPEVLGELLLERRDLRSLGDHAAAHHRSTAARSSSPMSGLAGGMKVRSRFLQQKAALVASRLCLVASHVRTRLLGSGAATVGDGISQDSDAETDAETQQDLDAMRSRTKVVGRGSVGAEASSMTTARIRGLSGSRTAGSLDGSGSTSA